MNIFQKAIKNLSARSRIVRLTETQRRFIVQSFGSFWANKFGLTQQNFIDKGYEQNVDVYSAIRRIVDASKNVNWVVEQKKGDSWEIINDTSLHELMQNANISKGLTWEDIIEQSIIYLLAGGNSIITGLKSGLSDTSPIDELDILPNRFINIRTNSNWFDPIEGYDFQIGAQRIAFTPSEVKHIKLFNPGYTSTKDMVWGLSPIAVASMVVQAGNDKWEADAALLQNKGAIGFITDKSKIPMSRDEATEVQEAFNEQIGSPGRFGQVRVTNKDLSFIQMAMSAQDLQMIEHGVVNLRAICNVLGLDSSLFNDPANKTFNNRVEAQKSMYTDAIQPINKRLRVAFNQWLVPTHFPNGNVRLRDDYSGIEALQEDFHEKARTFSLLKTSGIISANAAARSLNQEESDDPNADKLIVSSSNVLLETLTEENNDTE